MAVRGVRGATTVPHDTDHEIRAATRELLQRLVEANAVATDDIASIIFTVTQDLRSEFPARAARELGWHHVALLGATEMTVPGAVERCIRVLMHINTSRPAADLKHIYLRGARSLRPDR